MFLWAGVGLAGDIKWDPFLSLTQLKGLLMSAEQKYSMSKIDNSAPNTFK